MLLRLKNYIQAEEPTQGPANCVTSMPSVPLQVSQTTSGTGYCDPLGVEIFYDLVQVQVL